MGTKCYMYAATSMRIHTVRGASGRSSAAEPYHAAARGGKLAPRLAPKHICEGFEPRKCVSFSNFESASVFLPVVIQRPKSASRWHFSHSATLPHYTPSPSHYTPSPLSAHQSLTHSTSTPPSFLYHVTSSFQFAPLRVYLTLTLVKHGGCH